MTVNTYNPNIHNSNFKPASSFNDYIEPIKAAPENVKEIINNKSQEVKQGYHDLTDSVKSFSFNFDQHKLNLNNKVYDYTLLRHGADLVSLGWATIGEQSALGLQESYSALKSLFLAKPVQALESAVDAAWHFGVAGATYFTRSNFNDVETFVAGETGIALADVQDVRDFLPYAGLVLGSWGAYDLYTQSHA